MAAARVLLRTVAAIAAVALPCCRGHGAVAQAASSSYSLVASSSAASSASSSLASPVQRVVELLAECRQKVERDLAAEQASIEAYATFCDGEARRRARAIDDASREADDLDATIESGQGTVSNLEEEIERLGTLIAAKERELDKATQVRAQQHTVFVAAEKEMVASVDELARGVTAMKKGQSFLQSPSGKALKVEDALRALSVIVDSGALDAVSHSKLQSLLQEAKKANATSGDDDGSDFDYSLSQEGTLQPTQPKVAAFESQGGGIIQTLEDMEEKAEDTLGDIRKKEVLQKNAFALVRAALQGEIAHNKDKLIAASQGKAAAQQDVEKADGRLVEIKATKSSDEEYVATLKMDCQGKAREWEARERSAKEEIAAIAKASDILSKGVKASMVQVASTLHTQGHMERGDDHDATIRSRLGVALQNLSDEHKSFSLTQLVQSAASDPLGKVRGLIEGMIDRLMTEASEDATHEAFCQEEMSKSRKSQDEKQGKVDTYKTRMDEAATSIARLVASVKTLQGEIADIDQGTASSTEIRNQEHSEYVKASADFRLSAAAVAKAIEVLKSYYEGSLLQVSLSTRRPRGFSGLGLLKSLYGGGPAFGAPRSDAAHAIIGILEVAESDFTALLAEAEETEASAAKDYEALTQENRVARAAKQAEVRAKQSEMHSLKVALAHHKDDHAETSRELDAVAAYLEKLRPECESKTMSYQEAKAAREAEIEGLKDAVQILDGSSL